MATKRARIGILRARHDQTKPTISDQACIGMIMTNAQHEGVFDYWEYNTRGYIDFRDSVLFPWVDISVASSEVLSRAVHGQKAYDATKALPGAILDGFDGFAVLTYPGTADVPNPDAGKPGQPATILMRFDGGAGYDLNGTPACSLPVMTANHTFLCHELGHVLGFHHSYGVLNNGIDWDGKPPWDQGEVYGDPYDLMSSATFGTRNLDPNSPKWVGSPVFNGVVPAGWPNPGAASMGPALARAHVHLWDPLALPPGTVKELPYPVQGQVHRLHLVGAGKNSAATSLLVLHPSGEDQAGHSRCYVEYRSRDAWDQGLHTTGTDLSRRAVVVHTVNDAAGDGVRCWYRGRILVPTETDTDLAPASTPLVVRVIDVDDEAGVVEIEVTTSAPREIEIKARRLRSLVATRDEQTLRTPCGDYITSATRIYQSTSLYRASTRGYGGAGNPGVVSPVIRWTVGGQPLAPGDGTLNVTTAEGMFSVQYNLTEEPNELALIARGGERYTVQVTATATEPGGVYSHLAQDSFHPIGWTTGFTAADLIKLDNCIARKLRRVFINKRDWLVPPVEDPRFDHLRDRINQSRLYELVRRIAELYPHVAGELNELAQQRAHQLR